MIRSIFLLCLLSVSTQSFCFFDPLPDPENVKVSLLTVGVGSGIEKRYGHTILRVSDLKTGEEYLLNWGTFDFNQPNYVPRFLKGLLRYWVSESSFNWTIRQYNEYENRTVVEDSIQLSTEQKKQILKILSKRLQPEGVYFWYDFFYNNCSTIPRDILNEVLQGQIEAHFQKIPASMNLRAYVREGLHEWAIVSFFLDIILNSDVDKPITAWIEMFHPLMLQRYLSELPEYDEKGKALAGTKLLQEHHTVVAGGSYPKSPLNLFHIIFVLSLLSLISGGVLLWMKSDKAYKVLGAFSIAWGSFFGFHGLVLLAGWLFSDHHMLHHNANLLVLWPFDFAFVYFGLRLLKEGSSFLPDKKWNAFFIAHLVCLFIFLVSYASGTFAQDVSNIAYFLAPPAGFFFILGLNLCLRKQS